jgi:hypothetical protein
MGYLIIHAILPTCTNVFVCVCVCVCVYIYICTYESAIVVVYLIRVNFEEKKLVEASLKHDARVLVCCPFVNV